MIRQLPGSTPSRPQPAQSQQQQGPYRTSSQVATPSGSSSGMYYASAGQQQQQQQQQQQPGGGASGGSASQGGAGGLGGAVSSAGLGASNAGGAGSRTTSGSGAYAGAGGSMRGGPPGFGGRGADPNDFPALGSHLPSSSNSQQQSQAASMQQQLYMQSAQTPGGGNMVAPPPPPPGLAGPATPQSTMTNGMDEFPALGSEAKDARMTNYLRSGHAPPSPPNTLPNVSDLTSPSARWTALGGGAGGGPAGPAPEQPLVRPVQQVLSSPVDTWGLKALLMAIKAHSAKDDRGMLLFGEDLTELGVDVGQDGPLHSTFVTPWMHPAQIPQPVNIQEPFHTPQCYVFHAPTLTPAKLSNFGEDTLFLAFYSTPGDAIQLEVASELYNRGWRYHMDMQVWMQGPSLTALQTTQDPSSQEAFSPGGGGGNAGNTGADGPGGVSGGGARGDQVLQGPFLVFNPATFERTRTSDDYTVRANQLEETRPAAAIIAEDAARREKLAAAQGQQQQQQQQLSQQAQ